MIVYPIKINDEIKLTKYLTVIAVEDICYGVVKLNVSKINTLSSVNKILLKARETSNLRENKMVISVIAIRKQKAWIGISDK